MELAAGELERVLALDDDARYAYTIAKVREHGELWSLGRDDDSLVVATSAARGRAIPIWPHEELARAEAVELWSDATPRRIALQGWLADGKAAWFYEDDLRVAVCLVDDSARWVTYSELTATLRGTRRVTALRSSRRAPEPRRDTTETRDLVRYVDGRDIDTVIERVPPELRVRLRDVFRKRSSDARILGSVTRRGRRDIDLVVKLPVRVSLRRYLHGGQRAGEFGAPERGQWPPWAVRRFLLYDVLLHELGHLQVVENKFASERKAQELADELRRTLYSDSFSHVDPIHNAPTPAELATLAVWERLPKFRRAVLAWQVLGMRPMDMRPFEPLTSEQRAFLGRTIEARSSR